MKNINSTDDFKEIGEGIKRAVTVYNEKMMAAKVKFETATIVPDIHQHPHQQVTYVIEGEFVFWIDEKKYEVISGNVLLMEPNKPHGCICCSNGGLLLDVFTPMREDFI